MKGVYAVIIGNCGDAINRRSWLAPLRLLRVLVAVVHHYSEAVVLTFKTALQ